MATLPSQTPKAGSATEHVLKDGRLQRGLTES